MVKIFHIPPNYVGEDATAHRKPPEVRNLQIEEPVVCRQSPSFHFHPTLTRMLGATLIRHQVVEVCQPREKRLLPSPWMIETFHREQLPLDSVMRLIQQRVLSQILVWRDCEASSLLLVWPLRGERVELFGRSAARLPARLPAALCGACA